MCSSAVEWIPKDIPAEGLGVGEDVGRKHERLWDQGPLVCGVLLVSTGWAKNSRAELLLNQLEKQ